ncbi:MAG: TonB-dependent receptor plug domain-containing protein, partial [Bacteroidia bacterium]
MKKILLIALSLLPIISFSQYNDQDTLKELVISANKFWEKKVDIPRQIELVQKKDIAFLNQANTADLLQTQSLAYIQKSQAGGGSPILRGFEANRILLVIDGVRLNNAIFRGGHLQNVLRIDQNLLERTEVIYGPGSVMYGSDALGGVIHFVTKNPEFNSKIKGSAYYRYSSALNESTTHLQVQAGFKKWANLFGMTVSSFGDVIQGKSRSTDIGNLGLRNYYQSRQNNIDVVVKNNDPSVQIGSAYAQLDILNKFIFKQKEYVLHTFNLQISRTGDVPRYDRLSELKNDTPVFSVWNYGPEIRNMIAYQLENTLKRNMADRFKIGASIQLIEESRITRSFNDVNLNARKENVQVYSINTDFFKQIKKHEIRYGAEFNYNRVLSTAEATNIITNAKKAISTRYPDGGSDVFYSGLYISHSYELNPKLILSEGLRFNSVRLQSKFFNKSFYSFLPNETNQNNSAITGSIGLVYFVKPHSRFYINSSTGFRAPNVDDLNKIFDSRSGKQLIIPNEKLNPEKSWTSELGYQLNWQQKLQIGFNVYYTLLNQAIILSQTKVNNNDSLLYDGKLTKVYSFTNAQRASIYGYGFQLVYKLINKIKVDASYQYTYGRILADSIMPLDHIPPVYGRFGICFEEKRFQIQSWILFNGKKELKDYFLNGEDNIQYANPNG